MKPDEYTIAEHMLDVGHKHQLYIQDWGNKKAKTPIIFLHGGPGDGCKDKHKTPFDPKTQRVIFFDQRGSGKSLPYGRWHHNNTQELASDITKIADFLDIDQFVLTGASWGSTLALYYAISNPSRVEALVVSGIWTCSKEELEWEIAGVYCSHFPEAWQKFTQEVPEEYKSNPLAFCLDNATSPDPDLAKKASYAYTKLVVQLISLYGQEVSIDYETYDPNPTIINLRYMAKHCFLTDKFILKNAHKLKMPVYIIHGRYDMLCPPKTAYELSKLIPNSHLTWVVSGHRAEHETTTAQRLIYKHLTEK